MLATGVETEGDITVITVTFTAPRTATGSNYASLSYVVADAHRAATEIAVINIDIAQNTLPVATPHDVIVFDEEATSSEFTLGGTDEDVADADTLKVVIISLPENATLLADGVQVQVGDKFDKVWFLLCSCTSFSNFILGQLHPCGSCHTIW